MQKLYVVVRGDLKPGLMLAQSCHAAVGFRHEHEDVAKQWIEESNYIVVLSVKNEDELYSLICKAKTLNIKVSIFREPDINNEITAIALAPGEKTKEICSKLKLALRDI